MSSKGESRYVDVGIEAEISTVGELGVGAMMMMVVMFGPVERVVYVVDLVG